LGATDGSWEGYPPIGKGARGGAGPVLQKKCELFA